MQHFLCMVGCLSPHTYFIGDGHCDDSTNNIGCNFDGGDCCGDSVDTQYCIECICYENDGCLTELVGNSICNYENDNEECNFDGGDCEVQTGCASNATTCK